MNGYYYMNTLKRFQIFAIILILALTLNQSLDAREIWETGHIDIRVNYNEDGWEIDLHHEELGIRQPDDVILRVRGGGFASELGARQPMPDNEVFSFIGVNPGDPFWLLPSVERSWLVWPGIAIENTDSNLLHSYVETDSRVSDAPAQWVSIDLLSVDFQGEGSGNLSMWQAGSPPRLYWSTFSEPAEGNRYFIFRGTHEHMNWGFSQPGLYEIEIQASAFLADNPQERVYSDPVSIQFYVDPYGLWVHQHFSEEEESAGVSAPEQSPFGSGLSNSIAYALGIDPRQVTEGDKPAVAISDGEFLYSFPLREHLGLGTLLIEQSGDLSQWDTVVEISGGMDFEMDSPSAVFEITEDNSALLKQELDSAAVQFLRLRFEQP